MMLSPKKQGEIMTRDMDLIRELLLSLERLPPLPGSIYILKPGDGVITNDGKICATFDGYSQELIGYHLSLIKEARFIKGGTSTVMMNATLFERLSWEGHDFLDSVRSPEVWAKTKRGAEAAGGFTVDLLKDLAKGFVKKQIEEYTGVKL